MQRLQPAKALLKALARGLTVEVGLLDGRQAARRRVEHPVRQRLVQHLYLIQIAGHIE
ncbi:hypothetical protein [Pseudomonas sp. FH1]|uniref:hypothetical protein n=1 Tax=Pseudomonas sp. FH1 TaxID=1284392 RepID=UPI0012EAEC5D|nr:hypothetical protein [Pseudomonas sp. FH1]